MLRKFSLRTLSIPIFIVVVEEGQLPHAPCRASFTWRKRACRARDARTVVTETAINFYTRTTIRNESFVKNAAPTLGV